MSEADTQQTELERDEKGRFAGGTPPAGFNVHPENQSPGGWKKENTISYQYKRFLNMSPDELKAYSETPDSERTVAMDIAYSQVIKSRNSLNHAKEITDRTEGKAAQAIDITSNGESLNKTSALTEDELNARIEDYLKRHTNNRTAG